MSDLRLFELFAPPAVITLSVVLIGISVTSGDVYTGVAGGMLYTFGLAHQTIIIRDKYEVD